MNGRRGIRAGIPLRAVVPNAMTALALCFGLTGIRFAHRRGDGTRRCAASSSPAMLDGMDGRIARLLRGQSRFGAELDSLSDNIAFGVSPALILFLWSLQTCAEFGWIAALALRGLHVRCASPASTRGSMSEDQPHKSAGFLTGVPAPAGAGLCCCRSSCGWRRGSAWFQAWHVVMAVDGCSSPR